MKPLEVISVNLWQILISLSNLIILFLVAKRFLFRPVENLILKRQNEVDKKYLDAENYQAQAKESKEQWEEKMSELKIESEKIINKALVDAKQKSENLIEDATKKAEKMVLEAKDRINRETEKAEETIKKEIIDVSLVLAKEILMREVTKKDNSVLINSFIDGLGESYEKNR